MKLKELIKEKGIYIVTIGLVVCGIAFAGRLQADIEKLENDKVSLNKKIEQYEKENEYLEEEILRLNSEEHVKALVLDYLQNLTGLEVKDYDVQSFKMTYYTDLPSENGGYTITCNGEQLEQGMVASNHYPQGTKLLIDGLVYTVADRGSSRFDSPNRLDVFQERWGGESDEQYFSRVNKMGVDDTVGFVLTIDE